MISTKMGLTAVEIDYLDPLHYLQQLPLKEAAFLDSARHHSTLGRWSILGLEPFDQFIYDDQTVSFGGNDYKNEDPFIFLKKIFRSFKTQKSSLPFIGGGIGYFSYDLAKIIEPVGDFSKKDLGFPLIQIHFYDTFLLFDHVAQKAWLVNNDQYDNQARKRVEKYQSLLKIKPLKKIDFPNFIPEISPISNFTKEQYLETVHKIKNYILQGDIFQANLSQRFSIHQRVKDPIALYSILRQVNPAPFSAFLGYKDYAIASSSPERFLSLRNQQVETRPIKGTAPRSSDSLEDQRLATALQQSPKDRAENSMIVDLMRNDLSRVCEAGTLCVPQWCGLESFETVHHLVSVVQGHLKAEWGPIDLIQSTFPGGSITGAPKVRAMQIIDELEPTCRGPYCGSIGYIGFDESLDLSIAIRTLLIEPNRVTYQTGGAIILDSVAENEYDETLSKAQALQKAINLYFSQEQMHCHDTANR